MQLGDEVPYRVHWPVKVSFRVNQQEYRPYGRNAASKLGNNQVDDPVPLNKFVHQGSNSVVRGPSFPPIAWTWLWVYAEAEVRQG